MVSVSVPGNFPVRARIWTGPGNRAVTFPEESTVATDGVPLVHVKLATGMTTPSASLAAARTGMVCPTTTTVDAAVTSTRAIVWENAGTAEKTRSEINK